MCFPILAVQKGNQSNMAVTSMTCKMGLKQQMKMLSMNFPTASCKQEQKSDKIFFENLKGVLHLLLPNQHAQNYQHFEKKITYASYTYS